MQPHAQIKNFWKLRPCVYVNIILHKLRRFWGELEVVSGRVILYNIMEEILGSPEIFHHEISSEKIDITYLLYSTMGRIPRALRLNAGSQHSLVFISVQSPCTINYSSSASLYPPAPRVNHALTIIYRLTQSIPVAAAVCVGSSFNIVNLWRLLWGEKKYIENII